MSLVYLDYAAATPVDKKVLKAMEPYFTEKFYNPSVNYLPAKAIKDDIRNAKQSIAGHMGAKSSEIIHTSGGTEANNLAISGVMDNFPGGEVIISAVEHESVRKPAEKYKHKIIPVDKYGQADLAKLRKLISDETVLVSVMLANNETGATQPVKQIADIITLALKDRRNRGVEKPLYLHSDVCQAPCYMDVHASRLSADMMTFNGGKIYGPKGTGILFVKAGVKLKPQILGGGQQRALRSGTENPAGLIGFARALDLAVGMRKKEAERVGKLRDKFIAGIQDIAPTASVNGHPKKHVPHILNITFPGADNERLLFQLEESGVLAASGSACSASSEEPSHVLGAMGINDELARGSLRFSLGRQTDEKAIDYALKTLKSVLA